MISNEARSLDGNEEIDLLVLGQVLWRYKYLVVLIAALCVAIAVFKALTATPIFQASIVVTETHDSGMSPSAALASQFGGLASLAGINLGGAGSREAQAVLSSRRLIEEFIKRNNLIPELFPDAKKTPSLWLAVKEFQEGVLVIREDKRSGTIRITINWRDPATSARWANNFVALANELIRGRALDNATRNIAYLNSQIARTNVLEIQRVMYNLIESETKTQMLANAKAEYAFIVIDPAVPPEIRTSPKRAAMVLIGTALGFLIGAITAFVLNMIARRKRNNSNSPKSA